MNHTHAMNFEWDEVKSEACFLRSPSSCRLQIDFIVVTAPHSDDFDDQSLLDDFVDQSIASISQFDFLRVLKVAA